MQGNHHLDSVVEAAFAQGDPDEVDRVWFEQVMEHAEERRFPSDLFDHVLRVIRNDEYLKVPGAGGPLTVLNHFFDWLSPVQHTSLLDAIRAVSFEKCDTTVAWTLIDLVTQRYDPETSVGLMQQLASSPSLGTRRLLPFALESFVSHSSAACIPQEGIELLVALANDPDSSLRTEMNSLLRQYHLLG